MAAEYEILALRYGTRETFRADCFYGYEPDEPDEQAAVPLGIDYFFWVVRNDEETILVDNGFDPPAAARRGRTCLVSPLDALGRVGIAPDEVSQVVVSHFHYDHIGNTAAFPTARITMQRRELDFWCSPLARRGRFSELIEPDEVEYLATMVEKGRVNCIDGTAEIAPGVSTRLVGGHCPGQQITIVDNPARPVVIASDALHLYEELEREAPFATFASLPESYQCFDALHDLERRGAVLVPGHDPAVMTRFSPPSPQLSDLVVTIA